MSKPRLKNNKESAIKKIKTYFSSSRSTTIEIFYVMTLHVILRNTTYKLNLR